MASLAVINELNHEDSLNGLTVVTGDAETAIRQYMRKKPDEFYIILNADKSKIAS
jgi:hypothetical protein